MPEQTYEIPTVTDSRVGTLPSAGERYETTLLDGGHLLSQNDTGSDLTRATLGPRA